MIHTNEIPHLAFYKMKTLMPIVNPKTVTLNNMALLANKTDDSVKTILNHPNIRVNNKYTSYYIDTLYTGTINGKRYRVLDKQWRKNLYERMKKEYPFLKTRLTVESIMGKNVFVDLHRHLNLFFENSKKVNNMKKMQLFIPFFSGLYNDSRYSQYSKTIFIDVTEWISEKKISSLFDNPLTILYFLMWKKYDDFKLLGDINIIIYNSQYYTRLNPKECEEDSYRYYRKVLMRLVPVLKVLEDPDAMQDIEDREELAVFISNELLKTYNLVGTQQVEEYNDIIAKTIDESPASKEELMDEIMNNPELNEKIYKKMQQDFTGGKSAASLARDAKLQKEMQEIKVANMTIADYREAAKKTVPLKANNVANSVSTINKNVTDVKFTSFDREYNKTLYKQDMTNIFSNLEKMPTPVYIKDVKIEDNSSKMDLKETWTVEMEDTNRKRHTVKLDIPKLVDDRFLYLNGNRSMLLKQMIPHPIFKSGPDEVQFVSASYNKIFIRRDDSKLTENIERLKKLISIDKGIITKRGRYDISNQDVITTIEYDNLSKSYQYIKIGKSMFIFDQALVKEKLDTMKLKATPNMLVIGFDGSNKPIEIDPDGDTDVMDKVIASMSDVMKKKFYSLSGGKKLATTTCTIMAKTFPLFLLCCYLEGITTVLRKANVKHYFSDSKPELKPDETMIRFKNGYLVYNTQPIFNTFLLNSLLTQSTELYDYEEFDNKDAYLEFIEKRYGSRNVANAFNNFYNFMVDPVTKEVLEKLNQPTDFVEILLYCNKLLADNKCLDETDPANYRIRSTEIITSYVHKNLADAYSKYMLNPNARGSNISIPRDKVIKDLMTSVSVEPYSCLNPIMEMDKNRAVTYKGLSGVNQEKSYNMRRRAYHKNMVGLLGLSTSPDGNCGITRTLTLEPNILDARGFLNVKDRNLDELTDAQLEAPSELLTPLGCMGDDSIRMSMAQKQSKHLMPVEKSSPVLISNGAEQVVPYHICDDFSVVAKDDGEVVEVNNKTKLTVVKYKDGTYKAIDLNPRVIKNGAGGFFLSHKLDCELKVGQKFKKNDILAADKEFFTKDLFGTRMNIGSLQKIAIFSSESTFEDACIVTNKVANDMASYVCVEKQVVIGKNANVDNIVKVGDKVKVGDELISFEESFQEDSLNALLASVGDELKEGIKNLGKTKVKSKYVGVIEDIKIYTDTPLDDMSPSLQKIVGNYYESINVKKRQLDKYDKESSVYKAGIMFNEATEEIDTKDTYGKINGTECIDSVMIKFFIKYRDTISIGDKICNFTALKGIVSKVIPEGYEPYTDFRPDEEVSCYLSANAILARMTPSVITTILGNKVLVELKRKLQDIYNQ